MSAAERKAAQALEANRLRLSVTAPSGVASERTLAKRGYDPAPPGKRDRQRIEKLRATSAKLTRKRRLKDTERQAHLQRFAEKHGIGCFGAGPHSDRWAKSGWSKRGAWIVCVSCVARHRRKKGLPVRRQG